MAASFRQAFRVRYNECDPQGAVFNANYLTYFDMTVTEWWREAFGSYQQMVEAGTDMVVAEANVRYRSPLRFDEQFEVIATVANLGTTSLTTDFLIERDGEPAAEGTLRHVFIDVESGEKTPIPESIRSGLEA